MKNRVDIKCEGNEHHVYVRPYINGEYLPHCDSMIQENLNLERVKFIPGKLPWAYIENVETDLSQFINIAIIILHSELIKHGDLYGGFLASIRSAIREMDDEIYDDELAEKILRRIIGEE